MAKIRKSRTDTRLFLDIPSADEIEDEEKLKKKYFRGCLLKSNLKK